MSKRRESVRKNSALSDPGTTSRRSNPAGNTPSIPPGPPRAEIEDSFSATQPPTSHLFPSRPRASSIPLSGPSSLSRLLAQAPFEVPGVIKEITAGPENSQPEDSHPSAEFPSQADAGQMPPPPQLSPNQHTPSTPHTQGPERITVPLRPGSRASRGSTSSRFSAVLLPGLVPPTPATTVKAVATTALTEHPLESSISNSTSQPPSPVGSLSEGMANFIGRRRTTSYQVSRSSPLVSNLATGPAQTATNTWANLTNVWGFGRKKRAEPPSRPSSEADAVRVSSSSERPPGNHEVSASELLKRF